MRAQFEKTYGLPKIIALRIAEARKSNSPGRTLAGQAAAMGRGMDDGGLKFLLASDICAFFNPVRKSFQGPIDHTAVRDVVESVAAGIIEIGKSVDPSETAEIVEILQLAVGLYDDYTMRHQQRVSALSMRMGQNAGINLGLEELAALYIAASLHDIGKLAVPKELLCKVGKFADEEKALFGPLHLLVGYHLLAAMGGNFAAAADILLYNHLFDGYPSGLRLECMSIASQVLSAADYYDARTSQRSYNKPLRRVLAIREVANRNYSDQVIEALKEATNTLWVPW